MTRRCVTDEQYAALGRRLDEVRRRTDEGNLPFQPVMDALQRIIEGKQAIVEHQRSEKPRLLKALNDITVGPLTKTFDPNQFFQTRKGLWVSDEMTKLVKKAAIAEPSGGVSLKRFDLVKNAYDRDIKAELSQNHEVQLWQIANLIDAQEDGKDGPLQNIGYWNIFYVGGLTVGVYWHGVSREWGVHAWRLAGDRWGRGHRVFSSN